MHKKIIFNWQLLVKIFLIIVCIITSSLVYADFPPWDADVVIPAETKRQKQTAPHVHNAAQAIGYFFIRMFQVIVSPQDGPNCRFQPTCSEYGRQAVMRYGFIVGGFLAGERLIRCNPYSMPGHDPLPQRISE
ncbi:MAG: membrane protein insertion efficiency factor YidD [Spirochaetes bacterium]|nr:membrane protein insertion efficiency factor YidD [Spirochaetota bacterium]